MAAVVQPLPGSTFGPNLDLGGDTATRSSSPITYRTDSELVADSSHKRCTQLPERTSAMDKHTVRIGSAGCAATLLAGILLFGPLPVGAADAPARQSHAVTAVPKPGKSCPAKKLGKKAKDGKLTLVCKKVRSHDKWVISKTVAKKLSVAQVKKAFSTDITPAASALRTFEAKAEQYGTSITPAEAASISAPLAAAANKLDSELDALNATGTVETDIHTYVAEDTVIVGLLQQAGSQTSLTFSTWGKTLLKDAKLLRSDGDVLRSALGLPPAP
ncbi:MAG: hypothetical protein ABSB55_03370 [Acidimicrobiales bacterium]